MFPSLRTFTDAVLPKSISAVAHTQRALFLSQSIIFVRSEYSDTMSTRTHSLYLVLFCCKLSSQLHTLPPNPELWRVKTFSNFWLCSVPERSKEVCRQRSAVTFTSCLPDTVSQGIVLSQCITSLYTKLRRKKQSRMANKLRNS
jgi:hypothetical protein